MVVRVAQRAAQSSASRVVVAADDARIAEPAPGARHRRAADARRPSGSDRLAEACTLLDLPDDEIVVNVQGDEPLIEPALIDAVARALAARPDVPTGTAVHAIDSLDDFTNPNVVKAVLDDAGHALYFSRAPIPCAARRQRAGRARRRPSRRRCRAVGIYGYRAGFVRRFPSPTPAPLGRTEALEQPRALARSPHCRARERARARPRRRHLGGLAWVRSAARLKTLLPRGVQAPVRPGAHAILDAASACGARLLGLRHEFQETSRTP